VKAAHQPPAPASSTAPLRAPGHDSSTAATDSGWCCPGRCRRCGGARWPPTTCREVAAACRLGKLGCRLDPRSCFLRGCWRCCAQWVTGTGSVRCAQRGPSWDRSSWEPGFQARPPGPARRDSRVHQPPTGPKSPPHPPRAQAGCRVPGPTGRESRHRGRRGTCSPLA
jgi:hypothetical protein